MIIHHTDLLNALIEKHNLQSYLEIGIRKPADNFGLIKVNRKIGVDPECAGTNILSLESDKFFNISSEKFDLIFIDGLHHADQVKRDFENSLRCLNDNGA